MNTVLVMLTVGVVAVALVVLGDAVTFLVERWMSRDRGAHGAR